MFFLGTFSSYMPYLIMAIFWGLFHVAAVFGKKVPQNDGLHLSVAKTIVWKSTVTKDLASSTCQLSFEKKEHIEKKEISFYENPSVIIYQRPFFIVSAISRSLFFDLFSRPPPVLFLI